MADRNQETAAAAGQEWVDIVDDQGQTIATTTRQEMRSRRLPHRCVYVLVFDASGRLFIHQRTSTKDVYPDFWDVAAGGVLATSESFDEGAIREIREELGIDAQPEPLFPFHYQDENTVVFSMVYRITHNGPFRLQPEEIVQGKFVTWPELDSILQANRFCPDGLQVLEMFRTKPLAAERTT
jgi:8-oxo-dGTP pyrophosphatase MutT (NUDIX family)